MDSGQNWSICGTNSRASKVTLRLRPFLPLSPRRPPRKLVTVAAPVPLQERFVCSYPSGASSRLPLLVLLAAAEPRPLEFRVTFDKSVTDKPFTGRVYVMLSKTELKALPSGPNWFAPEPFFAWDVKDWKPGETLVHRRQRARLSGAVARSCRRAPIRPVAVMDFDRGISFTTH